VSACLVLQWLIFLKLFFLWSEIVKLVFVFIYFWMILNVLVLKNIFSIEKDFKKSFYFTLPESLWLICHTSISIVFHTKNIIINKTTKLKINSRNNKGKVWPTENSLKMLRICIAAEPQLNVVINFIGLVKK
jgi:hypothetical protein